MVAQFTKFRYDLNEGCYKKKLGMTMSKETKPLPNPLDGWKIIGQAALDVGFTRKTLTYWADQGYITSYYVGGRARIVNMEEVDSYAQKRHAAKKHAEIRKREIAMTS